MKFNEKLIELRKKEGLSQEELGYKLDVTRQTVSKWELGQTTPEMDKLIEISKLFNVSVDELINESEVTNNTNERIADQPIVKKSFKNNITIFVLVTILILILIYMGVRLFTGFAIFNKATGIIKDVKEQGIDQAFNIVNKTAGTISNQVESNTNFQTDINNTMSSLVNNFNNEYASQVDESKKQAEVKNFNSSIELYSGTAPKLFAETMLDNIVTSNKKNDKKITVKYNKVETKDTTQIKNIKKKIHSMSDFVKFDISCEYDKDGYIYEVIIEKM